MTEVNVFVVKEKVSINILSNIFRKGRTAPYVEKSTDFTVFY